MASTDDQEFQDNSNFISVATDTDESDASSLSQTEAPLIQTLSDSEEDDNNRASSMNDIDGDTDDEEENEGDGTDRSGTDGNGEEGDPSAQEEEERPEDEFTHATPLPCISNKPAGDVDWKEIVLARVCMFGNPEVCIQAIVLQTKDGTESGCADKSISRHELTKERIKEEYVMVEQPMGYVTRVTGYHSVPGKPSLLHSLKLEFASGQVIELQGDPKISKGEAFVVQDLADNFYLSNIEFGEGKCIGYSGYMTDIPLSELMEDESVANEDLLDAAQDDGESEYDDGYNPTRQKPKVNPPAGNGDDSDWVGTPLPATEIPRPPPDEDDSWRVSHVCLCGGGGPAVRGCIIHYYNGRRFGYLVKHDLKQTSIFNHEEIETANGSFIDVQQPGGYITQITGYQMGDGAPHYLCHSLQLRFASGQVIEVQGDSDPWIGNYFSYTAPEDFYIHQLKFDGDGRLSSVVGIRTEEMDFPPKTPPEVDEGKKSPCCPCLPC